jgi:hypothetical protein
MGLKTMDTTNPTLFAWTRQHWWQTTLLTLAAWTAFYLAVMVPLTLRQISAQRSSGLAAVVNDSTPFWLPRSARDIRSARITEHLQQEFAAARASSIGFQTGTPSFARESTQDSDRYVVRNATLELEVKNPAETAERIRQVADSSGGYLVWSQTGDDRSASLNIRVPPSRYEEIRAELKKLAVRVGTDRTDATDTTKDYVDKQARLRNLQTQELQYLTILKRATTVKDTLEVSEKLDAVRGQIEQQQAEFDALSKQVETVAISITLHAEADTQVFGIRWRPLYELKVAARDGLENLAEYIATMTSVLFHLPAFILWLTTIIAVAALAWRSTRWVWKTFFTIPQTRS